MTLGYMGEDLNKVNIAVYFNLYTVYKIYANEKTNIRFSLK